MHNISFVFDGSLFTIIFQGTLRDGPFFDYGVEPYHLRFQLRFGAFITPQSSIMAPAPSKSGLWFAPSALSGFGVSWKLVVVLRDKTRQPHR